MKRIKLINILLLSIIFISACGNKDKTKIESTKEKFANNVNNLINIVNENYIDRSIYNSEYHSYYLTDTLLYGYNYNFQTNSFDYNLKYDLTDMNIEQGKIIKNTNNNLYISIENNEWCAVKDFDENDFTIYDISEKEKCYISHYNGEKLEVNLLGFTDTQQLYKSGEINNELVSLLITSNLIDSKAATYQWYRNGEKIENSNYETHTITENEDAEYYVELTTTDGKTVKSEPFHVIIQK